MTVSVFSLSGIYEEESFWRESSDSLFFDLSDLPGTNGYLSDEATSGIRALLDRDSFDRIGLYGLHYIDSGNYHYMTKLFTERIRKPYDLILFDHHPDLQPPAFGGLMSCGSWLRAALSEDPFMRQAVLIGPDPVLFRDALTDDLTDSDLAVSDPFGRITTCRFADKPLTLLPEGPLPFLTDTVSDLLSGDQPVWISVDKDVLSPDDVTTNWDQGKMPASDLYALLSHICGRARVLGADICGECDRTAPPAEHAAAVKQNDTINANLLDIFRNAL